MTCFSVLNTKLDILNNGFVHAMKINEVQAILDPNEFLCMDKTTTAKKKSKKNKGHTGLEHEGE